MERISNVVRTQKRKLKMQLHMARYADLHVQLAAGNLKKIRDQFLGKI